MFYRTVHISDVPLHASTPSHHGNPVRLYVSGMCHFHFFKGFGQLPIQSTLSLCLRLFVFLCADHDEFLSTINTANQNGNVHVFTNHSGETGFSVSDHLYHQVIVLTIITVRKRSLRRLCFYTCLSVHRGGGGV